jgi:hypothetical protein
MGDQARATNHIMSIPPEQTAPPLPLSRAPYTQETISKQLYKVPGCDVGRQMREPQFQKPFHSSSAPSLVRKNLGLDKLNQSYCTHLVLVNAIKLKVNTFVTTNQF